MTLQGQLVSSGSEQKCFDFSYYSLKLSLEMVYNLRGLKCYVCCKFGHYQDTVTNHLSGCYGPTSSKIYPKYNQMTWTVSFLFADKYNMRTFSFFLFSFAFTSWVDNHIISCIQRECPLERNNCSKNFQTNTGMEFIHFVSETDQLQIQHSQLYFGHENKLNNCCNQIYAESWDGSVIFRRLYLFDLFDWSIKQINRVMLFIQELNVSHLFLWLNTSSIEAANNLSEQRRQPSEQVI